MGDPEVAAEASDSAVSRLFPKCRPYPRPRFVPHRTFNSTSFDTSAITTSEVAKDDLNSNRVSDDNANYELFIESSDNHTKHFEREINNSRYDSCSSSRSSSSISRMSIESPCATTSSSTPTSRSSSSHANPNAVMPSVIDRSGDDLSVVSAYIDDKCVAMLDTSSEDLVPEHENGSTPPINSSTPNKHNPAVSGSVSLHRTHLRDSRIENAGGKEIFNHSRNRSARKRQSYPQHVSHSVKNYGISRHSMLPQTHLSQYSEYRSNLDCSTSTNSSRSNSSNSLSSPANLKGKVDRTATKDEKLSNPRLADTAILESSDSKPPDSSSALVYETRIHGSNEIVFDDIGEWVERELSNRDAESRKIKKNQESNGDRRGRASNNQHDFLKHSQLEMESDYDADEESVMRVKKIGNVPIAEYEGSPRRYGHAHCPAKPGFPRRINSGSLPLDEVKRNHLNPFESERIFSKRDRLYQQRLNLKCSPKDTLTEDSSFRQSTQDINKEQINVDNDPETKEDESIEESQSPYRMCISTITSSYGASLDSNDTLSQSVKQPTLSDIQERINNLPVQEMYGNFGFEDSETRKVLEEFFLDTNQVNPSEFFDLEYTLKRQPGNCSIGHRLASTEGEEGEANNSYLKNDSSHALEETKDFDKAQSEILSYHQSSKNSIQINDNSVPPSRHIESTVIHHENIEMGHGRDFTLSPETTSCDSLDVESELSTGDAEDSVHSSGKLVSIMPVLEDGLSSGDESEVENEDHRNSYICEVYNQTGQGFTHQMPLQLFEEVSQKSDSHFQDVQTVPNLDVTAADMAEDLLNDRDSMNVQEDAIPVNYDPELLAKSQRMRSVDNHLCRGELVPNHSASMPSHVKFVPLTADSSPQVSFSSAYSPASADDYSHITSNFTNPFLSFQSPDSLQHSTVSSSAQNTTSSTTLTFMKKQLSEIERDFSSRRPDALSCGDETNIQEPNLDLHLLDPLNKKLTEPPPPPAPHPHRGHVTSGSAENPPSPTHSSTPPIVSGMTSSPNQLSSHFPSPQITPVSCGAPQLLSNFENLASPNQHSRTSGLHSGDVHSPAGNGIVNQNRESVEAAIADIKQAIKRTKNLPLKSQSKDRLDRGPPVWIPRGSRREPPPSGTQSTSLVGGQSLENSPEIRQIHFQPHHPHQQLPRNISESQSSPEMDSSKSHERACHEEEEGDTDQETDRLLGQQRSDNYLEEKTWTQPRNQGKASKQSAIPLTLASNHKDDLDSDSCHSNRSSEPSSPSQRESGEFQANSPGRDSNPDQSATKPLNKKDKEQAKKKGRSKEVVVHDPAVLIEGVLFRARYLGSTQLVSEGQPTKTTRMMQAEEAVNRIKAPEGEAQPSTEVDLFISTEKIMVLNTDLKEIMMDHALRTISYIADIGDLVVLMARRRMLPTDEQTDTPGQRIPKMICHVFESEEAQFIAQSIGQAFQVAYLEFLKANGIEDHSFVKEMDYQEVLNSQEIFGDELQMFAKKELQKEVVVPKMKGDILGVVVVESGWGSMVPTVVIANLSPTGAAARCGQLNIGDQIIAINGISLVGLPLSNCQNYIKNTKNNTAVKLTVVPCPPVVEVKIRRPDTKYQLGFSVQNGVICSLLRGGIAERGGVRVGHRIIDINSQSVVAVPHEKIVNLLATSVGEIRMKTMPTSIFRLLTGQENPQYI